MNFYSLIIGTEILNARREDKHFIFLRNELKKYGHELFASFIVKDDEKLIEDMFEFIKRDKNAVLFSFGGIGSTPDDLTRAISAKVFTNEKLVRHKQFEKDILDRFEQKAYPHRIKMSDLPKESQLLKNPVNNMSGYSLFNKFFFVPGFPQMAHPMIKEVLKTKFNNAQKTYRLTLLAQTSENTLIDIMNNIPQNMDLSSLPIIDDKGISVEISLSNTDKKEVEKYFLLFTNFLNDKKISYSLIV
jgi:molybdopterin-biosynthesis enzyme MoeA-like protein